MSRPIFLIASSSCPNKDITVMFSHWPHHDAFYLVCAPSVNLSLPTNTAVPWPNCSCYNGCLIDGLFTRECNVGVSTWRAPVSSEIITKPSVCKGGYVPRDKHQKGWNSVQVGLLMSLKIIERHRLDGKFGNSFCCQETMLGHAVVVTPKGIHSWTIISSKRFQEH